MKVIITMRVSNENNEQQQLTGGFANNYKIVSLILLQKLINDFAVCKHYSGTLLLFKDVSHGFWNENYIFQKGTTVFNIST